MNTQHMIYVLACCICVATISRYLRFSDRCEGMTYLINDEEAMETLGVQL